MVVQILLGVPLELVHKLWRIAGLYLAGVFTGALLVSAVDSTVYLGGASGGVYALLSAHLSNVIINWDEMEFNWVRALVIGAFVTLDVGSAVYQRYFVSMVNRVSEPASPTTAAGIVRVAHRRLPGRSADGHRAAPELQTPQVGSVRLVVLAGRLRAAGLRVRGDHLRAAVVLAGRINNLFIVNKVRPPSVRPRPPGLAGSASARRRTS